MHGDAGEDLARSFLLQLLVLQLLMLLLLMLLLLLLLLWMLQMLMRMLKMLMLDVYICLCVGMKERARARASVFLDHGVAVELRIKVLRRLDTPKDANTTHITCLNENFTICMRACGGDALKQPRAKG